MSTNRSRSTSRPAGLNGGKLCALLLLPQQVIPPSALVAQVLRMPASICVNLPVVGVDDTRVPSLQPQQRVEPSLTRAQVRKGAWRHVPCVVRGAMLFSLYGVWLE
jgi:hypothetical protein